MTRTYTIVIDDSGTNGDHGNGTGNRLADTGSPTLQLVAIGVLLLVAGLVMLHQAQLIGLPNGRHRRRN